jgi:uncharacterized membrane-anchored protein YhcB (DUF1043 family)
MEALVKWLPMICGAICAVAGVYVGFMKMRVWKRKLTSELITLQQATPAN